nr:OmpA family protein [Kofleriaceae bacterium]
MARDDDTGIVLDRKLPVPKQQAGGARDSRELGDPRDPREPRESRPKIPHEGSPARWWRLAVVGVVALLVGVGVRTWVVPDGRLASTAAQLADAQSQTQSARAHADELQADLDRATKARGDAEAKLADAEKSSKELADRVADAEKKAKEATAVEDKLRSTIDSSQGTVSSVGDEIHLQLVDHILFKIGDDQLTDKGKQVLDKVGAALRELPDKQVWVQGHTDDQPIYVAPVAAQVAPAKGAKGPAAKPVAPPPVKFMTNWELSAARALQVVHYLQDTAKLDPTRLAAVAFGQYHPVSRTDRAQNRRIEIVLYPKRVVAK